MACLTRRYSVFEILVRGIQVRKSPIFEPVKNVQTPLRCGTIAYSTISENEAKPETVEPEEKISRAMRVYMERHAEHKAFMEQQMKQFNEGKKILAKMMGKSEKNFTQTEINQAISYLFPSGLYEKKARPYMKNPLKVFASQKKAQFDHSGRPFHHLFYTSKPNYSQALHDCGSLLEELNEKIRKMGPDAVLPKPVNVATTTWVTKEDLEEMFIEKILDLEYEIFINAMNRLVEHPYSFNAFQFIVKYRKSQTLRKRSRQVRNQKEIEPGVFCVTVRNCRRKRCRATVKVISPGTGKITINNKSLIEFFEHVHPRQTLQG